MQRRFSILVIVLLFSFALAPAQKREDLKPYQKSVQLFEDEPKFSLDKLFSPEHFKMSHSYELSYGSFGGTGLTTGMYTAGMNWQFNDKMAARLDVGMMHTPFGTGESAALLGGQSSLSQVFVRSAELAYKPTKNSMIHLSFRQNPYGTYNPYGYGMGAYDRSGYYDRFNSDPGDFYMGYQNSRSAYRSNPERLFWRRGEQ